MAKFSNLKFKNLALLQNNYKYCNKKLHDQVKNLLTSCYVFDLCYNYIFKNTKRKMAQKLYLSKMIWSLKVVQEHYGHGCLYSPFKSYPSFSKFTLFSKVPSPFTIPNLLTNLTITGCHDISKRCGGCDIGERKLQSQWSGTLIESDKILESEARFANILANGGAFPP